jgi:hypothetical protein
MGIIIAALALILFIVECLACHTREMDLLTRKDAILIALAQTLAIFPGGSSFRQARLRSIKQSWQREQYQPGTPLPDGANLHCPSWQRQYRDLPPSGGWQHSPLDGCNKGKFLIIG